MDVLIASSQRDATAAQDIIEHHASLAGALLLAVEALVSATGVDDVEAGRSASDRLLDWLRTELLPHLAAETSVLFSEAERTPEGKLLVTVLADQHAAIGAHIGRISDAASPVRAAVAAGGLSALFESHVERVTQQLLPLLAATPGVSIADSLPRMNAHLNPDSTWHYPTRTGDDMDQTTEETKPAGSCGCGHHDEGGIPELDVQTIPHSIRHATIFGALDALTPGAGLIISATHDPVPLLAQLAQRSPGAFESNYVERGPERWRVHFVRH